MNRRQLRLAQRAVTSNRSTLRRSQPEAYTSHDYGVSGAAARQDPESGPPAVVEQPFTSGDQLARLNGLLLVAGCLPPYAAASAFGIADTLLGVES